ncbi:MAG: hypothetical protein ACI95C_002567 [Pseudohongiellaceae bacterium]
MRKDNPQTAMERSKRKVWSQILKSSEHMHEVAQRNDWELLQDLVLERKKLLSIFFAEPVLEDRNIALDQIIKDIQLILSHDAQTKSSSLKHKNAVHASLKTLNKGKAAVKLYR